MSHKTVPLQPTEGQFVEIWTYNNRIWSDVLKWVDGYLLSYSDTIDEFCTRPVFEEGDQHNLMWVIEEGTE